MQLMDSRKIVQENRDYTMFSWSVQGASNPIHMKRGQGVWFWDGDDNRWLDFSSQLINLNVGHQHPKMLEAIKMAKLFTGRDKIITRYRSYHGATMGSMTASGDPRRWPVEPGVPGIVRVF